MILNLLNSLNIIVFLTGFIGVFFTRQNLITIIISLELMLLSINLMIIENALCLDDTQGQIFVLMILTVAAAEAAIGLALVVNYYRLNKIIDIKIMNIIKA